MLGQKGSATKKALDSWRLPWGKAIPSPLRANSFLAHCPHSLSLSPTLYTSKQFSTQGFRLVLKLGVPWSYWTSLQIRLCATDGDLKKLRVRFSGLGKGSRSGSQASNIPLQESTALGRVEMSSDGEYDAAFAATIAAAAYAIAAQEEKLAIQKKPTPIEGAPPALTPVRRAESIKKPAGGSKISSWFSGKEPLEEDDYGPVNVSVRRPLKPTLAQPGDKASDYKVPSTIRPETSYHSRRNGDTAVGGMGSKTDEWEKAKLARIREEYEKMIETIAEWEAEKKMKARCKKEQKETELDRKRAKVLEEYNQEMSRINKISVGARSMAEERKYNDEKKIREKANKMRSTGKLPRTCACF